MLSIFSDGSVTWIKGTNWKCKCGKYRPPPDFGSDYMAGGDETHHYPWIAKLNCNIAITAPNLH